MSLTRLSVRRDFDLVSYSLEHGQRVLDKRSETYRKENGQFFTPTTVARFMARQLGAIRSGDRILDPAIGSGVLACAVIERAIVEGQPREFWLDGYEIDPELCQMAREILEWASNCAAREGIIVHARIHEGDFVLNSVPTFQPYLVLADSSKRPDIHSLYTHIIANPPYFKLNSNDPRVKAVTGLVKGHTNIYTLFLALAVKKLIPQGRACFIVPRSFCSGVYFSALRQDFIEEALPLAVHLFESRQDTFKGDTILQENIIFAFHRRQIRSVKIPSLSYLNISSSKDASGLHSLHLGRQVPLKQFLGRRHGTLFFRLPTGELDEQIVEMIDSWTGSLNQYGLNVSTGPVVAFRSRPWLMEAEPVTKNQAVPLLWMQNVKRQQVKWPVTNGNKPQGLSLAKEARSLLLPVKNYVLIRRFSAKEEPRRLIAAPFLADQYNYEWIGLENHLNYIYKKRGTLDTIETLGLSALLNSAIIDRYFRIVNGNTQVNATELRALPLPPLELIKKIGDRILDTGKIQDPVDLEVIVFTTLRESGYLPPDFPVIRETRITMGKIQEAQDVLKTLGLPPGQQNEISALTLLILAQLSEETPWREAESWSLRIHDILLEIKARYNREYAENTRETIRRQVIHQFIQAGLTVRNPDEPTLPTNSPRTHYALSDAALRTIRAYQSEDWSQAVQAFVESRGALLEIYQKSRERHKVPLRLADGQKYHLSPGPHNELQVVVIEEFGPRFAPGAKLLYLGDTENKTLILDAAGFKELDIPVPSHDKLPDIVLYDETRNWLFLIEAVTSHGPISPKRRFELEEALEGCSASHVYVTAFPDFATFKSFLTDVAWETEVWLAEIPDHLIHFNGDRFLGSYS
jgi:adenine-specific DNA-methyltransferase